MEAEVCDDYFPRPLKSEAQKLATMASRGACADSTEQEPGGSVRRTCFNYRQRQARVLAIPQQAWSSTTRLSIPAEIRSSHGECPDRLCLRSRRTGRCHSIRLRPKVVVQPVV